jgi:hypothetical protein
MKCQRTKVNPILRWGPFVPNPTQTPYRMTPQMTRLVILVIVPRLVVLICIFNPCAGRNSILP